MRVSPSVPQRASYDEVFDVPPDYAQGDVSHDVPVDVAPDHYSDVLPEVHHEAPRSKKSKKPLPPPREAEPVAPPAPARVEALSVCLTCGASPPSGDECAHDEVAHLASPTPAVVAAVKKLQAAVAERHAQERALRRAVSVEVSSGRGDVEATHRPQAMGPSLALAAAEGVPCAQCGHRPAASRAARRKQLAAAQASFAFVAPVAAAEPAPEPAPAPDATG